MDFLTTEIEKQGLKGVLYQNPNLDLAKDIWNTAEESNDNLFLSWVWIGPWLKLVRNFFQPNLFVVYRKEEVIAAVFFLIDKQRRKLFINSKKLFINEICAKNLNMIIEYNGILIKENLEEEVYSLFSDYLLSNSNWDEIVLNAVDHATFQNIHKNMNLDFEILNQGSSYQTIFDKNKQPFTLESSFLSRNKKKQIRRSKKYIEKLYGNISIERAENKNKAFLYFEKLGKLHNSYWNNKGFTGAFSNINWVNFNKEIISNNFENHHIDLLHIHADDFTIGYLYNLIYQGKVYYIQSGFNYLNDNKYKPGYLSHYLAMKYYSELEMDSYDFLAGGESYKKSLSNSEINLVWATIKKPKVSFYIESFLKQTSNYIKNSLT